MNQVSTRLFDSKLCGVNLQGQPISLNRRCAIATGAQKIWPYTIFRWMVGAIRFLTCCSNRG